MRLLGDHEHNKDTQNNAETHHVALHFLLTLRSDYDLTDELKDDT